jgi:hypothetical protein
MRIVWLVGMLLIGVHALAAPPPDVSGKYSNWFQSLTVPGVPNLGCCTAADCRMVDSRWNTETQRHEARVIREVFSNALKKSVLHVNNPEAFDAAKRIWIRNWTDRFGDTPEAWIEIPEARINHTSNPTGRAVLCWSTFALHHFNGVFCFVPFTAAFNDYVDRTRVHG